MAQAVGSLCILPDLSFALAVSPTDWTLSRTLAANTAEYMNVPAGANTVVFGADCSFSVRYNAVQAGTAAAANGDITDGTGCEVNPTIRYLIGGATTVTGVAEISLISVTGGNVSARFYK